MNPTAAIDNLIARHPGWRGTKLAGLRSLILAVDLDLDPGIVEIWNWMGSPE